MTDDEREQGLLAKIDSWPADLNFQVHEDVRFLRRRLGEARAAHDRRVTELLAANTAEVERRRASEMLLAACLQAQADGEPLPAAVDAATLLAERVTKARRSWTCFFCNETFTTPGSARDHFGADPFTDASCQIKVGEERGLVMALRRAEEELARYRAEDSDADRAMAAMQSKHSEALRQAEELGYAKGVRDGRQHPVEA